MLPAAWGNFSMSLTREFLKNCIISLPLAMAAAPASASEKIPDFISIPLNSRTFEPPGHMEFCKTHVDECNVRSSDTTPLHFTRKIWNDIVEVNASVNKSVKGISDMDLYGRHENWTYPVDGSGDCEDYALQKRKVLLQRGMPHSSLLLTVVKQADGNWHAVLTVRTDRGDYFLDNLVPQPYLVSKSNYKIMQVQSPAHSGEWLLVDNGFVPKLWPPSVAQTSGKPVPATIPPLGPNSPAF
jgi:predicted transglutaminase-like cysteine proteinase